jgi:hypothetical protein
MAYLQAGFDRLHFRTSKVQSHRLTAPPAELAPNIGDRKYDA